MCPEVVTLLFTSENLTYLPHPEFGETGHVMALQLPHLPAHADEDLAILQLNVVLQVDADDFDSGLEICVHHHHTYQDFHK
jgi:hypothetical protein